MGFRPIRLFSRNGLLDLAVWCGGSGGDDAGRGGGDSGQRRKMGEVAGD